MLSQARLMELLHYDPDSGVWTRLVSRGGTSAGDVAGCWHSKGYLVIAVDGVQYLAHRLAFLFMTGSIPFRTDHANGVRHDNRWDNLRPATASQNNSNRSFPNKLGFRGVSKNRNRFVAKIRKDRASIYLGTFDTPEDAHAAYVEAANEIQGEFARAA